MKKLILLFSLYASLTLQAQFSTENIITENALGAESATAGDIDGDGYKDILSSNRFESTLTWYKNIDGSSFTQGILIDNLQESVHSDLADVDGDGFLDVIAVSGPDDLVVWYKNMDGLGTFSSRNLINNLDGAHFVIARDIDDDGDLDIVTGSNSLGLSWHKNVDGIGTFGPRQIINNSAPNSRSIAIADLDGDGDLDVAGSSSGSVTVSWYENTDGEGTFGAQQIVAGDALTVSFVHATDIDGDGDPDLVASTNSLGKVAWYENEDGLGTFGTEQLITNIADGVVYLSSGDLDLDGDIDLLSASTVDDKIAWYENTGSGNFGNQQVLTNTADAARSVEVADLDNDGDLDVIAASIADDTVSWFENLTILGVEDTLAVSLKLHPNPAGDIVYIKTTQIIENTTIFNISGKKLYQKKGAISQLDIASFAKGILFVSFEIQGNLITKKVVKK